MKAFTLFRRLFLGSFFLFWGLTGLYAQDTIQLTWQGGTNKLIWVDYPLMAPYSFPIRINWGDGFMTDTVAEYNVFSGYLTHSYADTTRNYAVTITSYRDSVLAGLDCESQQISRLDVSRCAYLTELGCNGNQLPLSELYKILEDMKSISALELGPQHLLPQQILVGSSVDYSDQAEFGGIATVFNVEKNGIPAALNNDYTIVNGIILFNAAGKYVITMTNAAIISNHDPLFLAKVIAEINVVKPSTDATLSSLSTSSGELDPAFDSTITNYTVCVGNNVQEILLKAAASDPKATVSGTGLVKLITDTTILTVTVTAEDGITTKDYIVTIIKGCDVGVKEITQDIYNIKVYPNPTNGQLTIASPNPSTRGEQPTIEIVDIMGKCVFTSPNPSKGGEQPTNNVVRQPAPSPLERAGGEVLIDISHLQSGIYFLKINNKLIKLIKN